MFGYADLELFEAWRNAKMGRLPKASTIKIAKKDNKIRILDTILYT